jgi:predicted NBD/HSP70 family sugar kinase
MEHSITFTTKRPSATKRTPRHINRNLLFEQVRARQPVSRAELSRITGLQRSTVSIIVEELVDLGWVIEGDASSLPRGRRPTMIQLNDRQAVLALDIHPAEMTIAVADLSGRIIAQNVVSMPQDQSKSIKVVISSIRNIIAAHPNRSFNGIGVSIPGRIDSNLQEFTFAPRLRWPFSGLNKRIQKATGLQVEIDNVANACALAEIWFGGSDGLHDLAIVNVSEGIAVGIFANGKILRGDNGMAGEFGHVQIYLGQNILCECGRRGCWETLASNTAALRYYRDANPAHAVLTFDGLLRLAMSGEKAAVNALKKMAVFLASGIQMLIAGLAPKEIIIVGDVTAAWHILGPIIDREVRKAPLSRLPIIRTTRDGSSARLRGAAALVLSKIAV